MKVATLGLLVTVSCTNSRTGSFMHVVAFRVPLAPLVHTLHFSVLEDHQRSKSAVCTSEIRMEQMSEAKSEWALLCLSK